VCQSLGRWLPVLGGQQLNLPPLLRAVARDLGAHSIAEPWRAHFEQRSSQQSAQSVSASFSEKRKQRVTAARKKKAGSLLIESE
jgi:aminopeptidase N